MTFDPSEPQRLLIDHMLNNPATAGFVGMGIGKTSATLYALNEMLLDLRIRGALVVAPLRVVNLTWPMEVEKFEQFSWMRVANLRTKEGKDAFIEGTAQLYLVNYESLHLVKDLLRFRKKKLPYDVEVWDELSLARNPSGRRINGFRRDVPRCPIRWGLTGTPAPNTLMDLFAQIRLLDDGAALGKTHGHFQNQYFESDYMGWNFTPRPEAKEQIYARIAHMTVTLRSEDWLDIPDVHVEDVDVHLPDMKAYQRFEKDLLMEVKGETVTAANAAVLIGKLLQFTSGAIYSEDKETLPLHDAKLDALEKLVKKIKAPTLVAVNFRHEIERLRQRFPKAKFFEDARTNADQLELLKQWNAGKVPMLVAHPASVGHGLNLQAGGCHIVWMTLTHSREQYEQMNARLARRGQDKVVTVYRLMCPGTVDDAVAESLREKEQTEQHLLKALKMLESSRKH